MARRKNIAQPTPQAKAPPKPRARVAAGPPSKVPEIKFEDLVIWIVGDTPLITHAWSEKAKQSMLSKQLKDTAEGQAARDPEADFEESLYAMAIQYPNGKEIPFEKRRFGFPVTAVKKAFLSVAHKDKGVPRATVQSSLWIDAGMVRTMPALAGAVCDMPLVRIYGSKPEMREDMVRVGVGQSKKATLAYRAQFSKWAIRLRCHVNTSACPTDWIVFLAHHSGLAVGIGDWRNEKSGMFGTFHLATNAEAEAWELFRQGKGPIPAVERFGGRFAFPDEAPDADELAELAEAA